MAAFYPKQRRDLSSSTTWAASPAAAGVSLAGRLTSARPFFFWQYTKIRNEEQKLPATGGQGAESVADVPARMQLANISDNPPIT